jgi:hypothetical protein
MTSVLLWKMVPLKNNRKMVSIVKRLKDARETSEELLLSLNSPQTLFKPAFFHNSMHNEIKKKVDEHNHHTDHRRAVGLSKNVTFWQFSIAEPSTEPF